VRIAAHCGVVLGNHCLPLCTPVVETKRHLGDVALGPVSLIGRQVYTPENFEVSRLNFCFKESRSQRILNMSTSL